MLIDHDMFFQTGVSPELWSVLKAHAALQRVSLYDLHREVILLFLEHREALRKEGHQAHYLSSPRGARPYNLRMPATLAEQVQALSEKDNVSTRRIVFSALVHFAMSRNLTALLDSSVSAPADREQPAASAAAKKVFGKSVGGTDGPTRGPYHF
jgi:hypothetical protein